MFKLNNDHKQMDLFTAANDLQPAVARRLKGSWAPCSTNMFFVKLMSSPSLCSILKTQEDQISLGTS